MKNFNFSNWSIILLWTTAMVGFCFTLAFADEPGDGSFGQRWQTKWVHATEFMPDTGYSRNHLSGSGYLQAEGFDESFTAVLHLPSGAYLEGARFYYYDLNNTQSPWMTIDRYTIGTQGQASYNKTLCKVEPAPSGTPRYTSSFGNCTGGLEYIKNYSTTYFINVKLYQKLTAFYGVRLWWRRMVNPVSTNPFDDIGHLPYRFRIAIMNLASSGITKGCTATSFCPDKVVNRAQMAVFLAEALGLHWDLSSGY